MNKSVKKCTRCMVEKPRNEVDFPLHNKTKDGLDSWCRKCRATYRNEICRGKFRNVISDENLKIIKNTTKECVICGDDNSRLVVDHDHKTGKIRGMLCNHCNRGIGHFRDDPVLLRFAATYVEQFPLQEAED
jgi:hypothetical protein